MVMSGPHLLWADIKGFFWQVDGAGVDGGLPTALAEAVRPAAIAEYERALRAVFSAGAEVWSAASGHVRAHVRTDILRVTVSIRPRLHRDVLIAS